MQKQIVLFLFVLAFCMLGLLIEANPFWISYSNAISRDRAAANEFAAALKAQQQTSAKLTRSELFARKFQDLETKVQRSGTLPVIVKLRIAYRPESELVRAAELQAQRVAMYQTQDLLMKQLRGHDPRSLKRFDSMPYIAVKVNAAGLESLRLSAEVLEIQEDELLPLALAESVPSIGAPVAWANGYTGAGKAVAILDTGVDKTHSFLSGKVISEACYSTNDPESGAISLCPDGATESTSVDSGLNCTGISGCEHGTHVAGIAAGRGINFSGVAKDADLISIKVFSRFNTISACAGPAPCLRSFTSDLMKGLERVYALRDTYSIAAANLSLGGGGFNSNCDDNQLKGIIDQLRSVGIATVIASGNGGLTDAISSPACISSAISVGATGDGSRLGIYDIGPYSNSASFLSLLAPGDAIVSSVPGNKYANFIGTSMAAPHVAGAFAILRQEYPSAGVTEILNELTTTGVKITDPRNGITTPRIYIGHPPGCFANVSSDQWRGEYYKNRTLTGIPVMVRDDGAGFLNFNFGDGSPSSACGLDVDNFSVRWTRTVNFAAGTYHFSVTGDDGVRLYVDGQLRIDQWYDQPPTTYTDDVVLSAGKHDIVLEYYEGGGGAVAAISWSAIGFASSSCLASVPANRWRGEYYNNSSLKGDPVMVRDEGVGFLNFNFGNGSPSSACGLGVDQFSARWTRTVNFAAGTYRFTVTGDDGVRLYVDGQLRIDQWYDHGATTYTTEFMLLSGNHDIVLEYYENAGGAVAALSWSAAGGSSCLADVSPDRWRGEYFSNNLLAGSPVMVRDDGADFINFDFGTGSPSGACGLGVDFFSVRWRRTVNFAAGTYRFYVIGDDGVRLYVDGQLKINGWIIQAPTIYTADVALSAGNHAITLEYFENSGGAQAFLSWTGVSSTSALSIQSYRRR